MDRLNRSLDRPFIRIGGTVAAVALVAACNSGESRSVDPNSAEGIKLRFGGYEVAQLDCKTPGTPVEVELEHDNRVKKTARLVLDLTTKQRARRQFAVTTQDGTTYSLKSYAWDFSRGVMAESSEGTFKRLSAPFQDIPFQKEFDGIKVVVGHDTGRNEGHIIDLEAHC